ncbi:MAG TPA: CoA transferase, partial [Dehalococcoidia bacterium]|nr:CoA transferase [Dehalococcoidia bacterium]
KDGSWLHLNMPAADRYWPRFCEALGLMSVRDDPRFQSLGPRSDHSAELVPLIDAAIAQRTRAEWGAILDRYDLVWAPVQDVDEVIADPQVLANNYIAEIDHPTLGRLKTIDTPVRFSGSHVGVRGPAPELGQHTEEILLEQGCTWDEITRLRDAGAIGSVYAGETSG